MSSALSLWPSAELSRLGSWWQSGAAGESLERRKAYLKQLREMLPATNTRFWGRINAHDKSWEQWLDRTSELPPDFGTMPRQARLPDPSRLIIDGRETPIRSVADWEHVRPWIKAQFEQWIVGRMPPHPSNLRATVVSEVIVGQITVRDVRLEFGPDHRATLGLQVQIPAGAGPFPAFVTNHPRRRPWVNTAVRRGYLGCIYYAIDSYYGAPDDSDHWIEVYPDYDFCMTARWAWAAMRAVDYLTMLPYVRKDQIAIAGHSRNSKQALLAAAFDERIGAVVPSRGNTGDQVPWRFASEMFDGESLEALTNEFPNWFHPRLRFFVGREDALPVDQNLLMGLVAPRGLMLSHASMEHQGNPMGVEMAYRSVRQVYDLYGKRRNLGLFQQPGEHPSSVEDAEQYFDFFDHVFGRGRNAAPEIWTIGYTFEQWKATTGQGVATGQWPVRRMGDFMDGGPKQPTASRANWPTVRAAIIDRMNWALGTEPPGLPLAQNSRGNSQASEGWRGDLFRRPISEFEFMQSQKLQFGDDLVSDLYYPTSLRSGPNKSIPAGAKIPAVIWLHPYSYAMGYAQYAHWAGFIQAGFAVFCFDQIGFGVRSEHSLRFYQRYPRWSLLGKMVTDTRAAIDEVARISWIDPARISVAGYALGGKIALWTAALDERISAVAVRCAFAPLRLSGDRESSEGIRHYSHIHGLLPKLGAFIGQPARLPVDYDEILAAIAPRPVLVVAPELDRYNPVNRVKRSVEASRRAYGLLGAESALEINSVLDWNRYGEPGVQEQWLAKQAGLPARPSAHPPIERLNPAHRRLINQSG